MTNEEQIEDSGILAHTKPRDRVNWLGFAALVLGMVATIAAFAYWMRREQSCSAVIRSYENRPAIQQPSQGDTLKYQACKRVNP